MFFCKNLDVNERGNLTFAGVDTVEIANKYKTPLYVMDADLIRENCKKFQNAIKKHYKENSLVCFASKAFSCKEIYRIMKEEEMGIDTVSIGEMYTAISAGFPSQKIYLHGNGKTKKELEFAIENKIGRIVVDNITEMLELDLIAKENNVKANILLRLKPGVDAHVHEYVTTGKIDSKFGLAIDNDEALRAISMLKELENLNLVGFHCHIGSQIFETKPFLLAAEKMIDFIKKVRKEEDLEIKELNLGGGFGVKCCEEDDCLDIDGCIEKISSLIIKKCEEYNLKKPCLIIEPGRSIVAQAGITLYTVSSRKETANEKIYIAVDGGMTDNPRYILYKSIYEAVVANKAGEKKSEKVTIAGKCCESGDLIGENVLLQPAKEKDILAVFATGAYNYSMSSNYNRNLNPAVLFIENKKQKIVVKRQTLEDLIRNDV